MTDDVVELDDREETNLDDDEEDEVAPCFLEDRGR